MDFGGPPLRGVKSRAPSVVPMGEHAGATSALARDLPVNQHTVDRIQLDTAQWPVVVITPPGRPVADDELQAFLDQFAQTVVDKRMPYVLLLNLLGNGGLSPKQRQILMKASDRHENRCRLGIGLVFQSSLLRGMLTAILWLRNFEEPVKVFASVEAAMQWGQKLAAEGTRPPKSASAG